MPSFEARVTSVYSLFKEQNTLTQPARLRAVTSAILIFAGFCAPALALDCQKATSAIDKAICADPAAAAADTAMGSAYSVLFGSASDSEKKQILRSQREWLKLRSGECSEDKKPSVTCLREWTERRSLFLQGKPETGPGTGPNPGHDLIPIIIAKPGTPKLYELDIALLKFITPTQPGEELFNKEVAKLVKEAPSGKDDDDQRDVTYSYDLHMRLTYASPKFLSARMENYLFSGGAHGNSSVNNINIDVVKGKDLSFADVFTPEAKAKLSDLCFSQIKAQKKEKDQDMASDGLFSTTEMRKTIEDGAGKFDGWSFTDKQATISFDPYELGAYVEGSYECTFSNDVLHPLYKADSVLP